MAFLPHGISHSLKAMFIPMLHVCLAVQIADARSQDFTTCKLIILSLLLNVVSKNLLQPLLLLALGTSDSHIKRVFNLVKTRLNRWKFDPPQLSTGSNEQCVKPDTKQTTLASTEDQH